MNVPSLKLISHKLCPYVQRARIVLDEKSIAHEIAFIDLARKPDWFLKISPLGKVPLLLADGQPLFESAVICEYLDEITPGTLHPSDPLHKAGNRAWSEFASSVLANIATFYSTKDRDDFEAAISILQSRWNTLEAEFIHRPWFNGEHFSMVDAAFAPVFRYFDAFERYADFGFFAQTPNIDAWRERLGQRPSVQRAVVPDYPQRLDQFLAQRDSVLGALVAGRQSA